MAHQPRGEVHGLADDRVLQARRVADEAAERLPRRDARARREPLARQRRQTPMRGGDRSMLVVLVRVPTKGVRLSAGEKRRRRSSSRGVGPRASVPLEVRSSARPTGRGAPNAPMKTTPLSSTANCRSMPWYARNERVAASMAAWTGATSPCNNAGSRPATSTKTVTTSRNAPSKPGAPLSRSARAASGANARSGLAIGLASAAYADLASLAAATASASSGAGPPISAGSSCHAALLTRSPPCARACETKPSRDQDCVR